jgi:hypothetical protein
MAQIVLFINEVVGTGLGHALVSTSKTESILILGVPSAKRIDRRADVVRFAHCGRDVRAPVES